MIRFVTVAICVVEVVIVDWVVVDWVIVSLFFVVDLPYYTIFNVVYVDVDVDPVTGVIDGSNGLFEFV